MAGRNANISVKIEGEADFTKARREAKTELDKIEREADAIKLSPEVDTAEIRQALALAKTLDGLTAEMTVDADVSDIVEAEKLAKSLRAFQARVNLSVEGKAELTEALNLSEQMDRIRTVRVEVQGRQDLERAAQIADDLERRRTVPIDAQASDLVRLDNQVGDALSAGGEDGAEGIAGSLADIDFADIGSAGLEKLTGALSAAGPWAAVAAGVGAIFGDEFLAGFNSALPSGRQDTARALRTNLSGPELEEVGQAAGDAWASGFGEALPQLKDDAASLQQAFGSVGDDLDLSAVLRQAESLSEVFGLEVPDQIRIVQQLVKNGLVPDAVAGFNLIAREAQTLGGATEDAFDVITEFSPVFKKLGVDGAQAADIIAKEFDEGLVTQIDRAGEQFEEFNIRMTDGSARDAVQALGLDFEDLQDKIANGQGQEALAEIAGQLAVMPDKAEAASLGVSIFGASVESAADPQRVFELLATADAIGDIGTAGEDMADQLEDSSTGLDKMKRAAVDLGEALGGTVADGIETLNALAKLDFTDAAKSAVSFGEGLAEIANPLGPIAALTGVDLFGPLKDGLDALNGSADELPPRLASTVDKMGETTDASGELADGLDTVTTSADELEAQLRGFFDFSADQLFRDIAEGADRLAEALADGGAKAVEMSGDIDITTEAGRSLQEQLERVNGTLIDAEVAYANGEISAEGLADVHASLRNQLAEAGREAGLTKDQVQRLTDKYLAVPDDVSTDFTANTTTAINNVTALSQAIANIKSKSVTISASISGPTGISASGTIARKAKGGWTEGLTLVGEEGPELIDVRGRAFVHTAQETKQLMSNRGGDLGGGAPVASIAGGPRINIEQLVVDKGVDLWQQLDLAELVYGHR